MSLNRVQCSTCKYFVKFIIIALAVPHSAVKAVLIFPPTAPTRIQWIAGIGIPVEDLRFEAITTGWVFKAEYFLPETVEQLTRFSRLPISAGRKLDYTRKFENFLAYDEEITTINQNSTTASKYFQERPHVRSSYRWTVYKGLEGFANRIGLSGRYCILKSICEEAENPFHFYNGLLGELLHILLTPSTSADRLSTHSDNEYYNAEQMGRSGVKCDQVFPECPESLLNRLSDFHTLSKDIMDIVG